MSADVPSPIDLRLMSDAREWADTAMAKRPYRVEFFAAFARLIQAMPVLAERVLELGSGPGFLAEHLLRALPAIRYTALDFSAAMHQLAAARLGVQSARVEFIERSFLAADWTQGLPMFDAIVTNQAVHELRHKRHACGLHQQAKTRLAPGGIYLVCDHHVGEGGMQNDQLYMSVAEQREALLQAGFERVVPVLCKGGLVLHCASAAAGDSGPDWLGEALGATRV